MQHPLIPTEQSSKPAGASKQLVLPMPSAFGVTLEALAVLLSIVAAPLLALVVLCLSAYKTTVGWMRTSLQAW